MLKVSGIEFSYDKKNKILDGVSFEVAEGEVVAVLGGSGSGKSTLLSIIVGLEEPGAGEIILEGRNITEIPCEKRGIGLVFQDYALFPHLNVEKNVGFALKRGQEERITEMLELVRMQEYRKRYPYELSGGEKQRIAIARSLAAGPKLLLMDEPFSNLDANLRSAVRQEIKGIIKKAKITVILVTHDIEDATELSDRIIYLKNGRIDRIVVNERETH
ncbi:MAG: ABC transporter ATP-binding protein [Bacillota bacterium]|nr:ABC transporter ATP-binding protein [Bacillota bacterium]